MDRREPSIAPLTPGERRPSLVRPYTLTAGRTGTDVDLPLEAPLQALEPALAHRFSGDDVRGKIIALCGHSPERLSTAEISVRLDLPVGVARVLIGDLVTADYLRVHRTLTDRSTRDERHELIGRTLRGLRGL